MKKKDKQMKRKARRQKPKSHAALLSFLFTMTIAIMASVSFLYGRTAGEILRDTILTAIGTGAALFLIARAKIAGSFLYDNGDHLLRFFFCYVVCLAVACIAPLLPSSGWPFAAVFVVLYFFSNMPVGIVLSATLLMMSVLLRGADVTVFFLYLIGGLAVISLFVNVDESYKIGLPLAISAMTLLLCQTAVVVIHVNGHWSYELFIIPVLSLAVNIVAIYAVFRYFSAAVVHRESLLYMTINDQEYSLLVELKKQSLKEYYRAVHTVHFCKRIADKIGLESRVVETGGYYHRIGVLKGENTFENVKEIYEEHGFPPKACRILQEYNDTHTPMESREVIVVLLSDMIISTIMAKFEEGAQAIEYDKLIDHIFDDAMGKGAFNRSAISISDLVQMQEIFKKDKLYYDFLH